MRVWRLALCTWVHFHVLLVEPGAYLEPHSPLYITQEEWASMWRKALCADGSASLISG